MADSKVPKITGEHNAANMLKAGKRYKQIIDAWKEKEDYPVKPWTVLPSPMNRWINMPYAHCSLGPGIVEKSFDPHRPKCGHVVRRTDPDKIKCLKNHARALSSSCPELWPPLHLDSPQVCMECVGGNHLFTVFKFFEASFTSPINGITYTLSNDEPDLVDRIQIGHPCIVLRDGIPDDDLAFLAEYLNADQNDNQGTSDMATLSAVNKVLVEELKTTPHPAIVKVISKVTEKSLLKLKADSIADQATFCAHLNPSLNLMEELMAWHSRHVNPKEMSVSPGWLGTTAKALGKIRPICLFGSTLIQYRGLNKLEQVRPSPDISRSIGLPEVNSVMKDPKNIDECEELLGGVRNTIQPEIAKRLGSEKVAQSMFHKLVEAVCLLLYSKSLATIDFHHKVSGKFTHDKMLAIQAAWLKQLEANNSELEGIALLFGIDMQHFDGGLDVPDDVQI
jgi:hypothetical protein